MGVWSWLAKKLKLAKVKNVEEIPGMGLKGYFGKYRLVVGRRELVEQEGMSIPKTLAAPIGKTSVYIAVEQAVAGVISFYDRVREKSKNTPENLPPKSLKK